MERLKIYFGEDYKISPHITIRQPTIGDIIEMGEKNYYNMISTLTAIPSDMISELWDQGIDWETISDFELFISLKNALIPDKTKILFGDFDFTKLEQGINQENKELVLHNFATGATIDKRIYLLIVSYVRKMHGIVPKIKHAYNKTTKNALIEIDREDKKILATQPTESKLFPLISSMLNTSGFKYKKQELKNVHLVEFFDSVKRTQAIELSKMLYIGIYSGSIDTKKTNIKKELDWLRELE